MRERNWQPDLSAEEVAAHIARCEREMDDLFERDRARMIARWCS